MMGVGERGALRAAFVVGPGRTVGRGVGGAASRRCCQCPRDRQAAEGQRRGRRPQVQLQAGNEDGEEKESSTTDSSTVRALILRLEVELKQLSEQRTQLQQQQNESDKLQRRLSEERAQLKERMRAHEERESLTKQRSDAEEQSPLGEATEAAQNRLSVAKRGSVSDERLNQFVLRHLAEGESSVLYNSENKAAYFVTRIRAVDDEQMQTIEERVLHNDVFELLDKQVLNEHEKVLYVGRLRMSARNAYSRMSRALLASGLGKQLQLFMYPNMAGARMDGAMVLVLPRPKRRRAVEGVQSAMSAVSFAFTSLTVFAFAICNSNFDPVTSVLQVFDGHFEPGLLWVTLGTLGLSVVHELGHTVAAAVNRVSIGSPLWLPSFNVLHTGLFGAFTPILKPPRDRRALFDVLFAGPACGLIAGVGALWLGMMLTPLSQGVSWFPQVSPAQLRSSLLVNSVSSAHLSADFLRRDSFALHPLALAGWNALWLNALNMLPFGRLDGGYLFRASVGRVFAPLASLASLLAVLLLGVLRADGAYLSFAAVMVLLLRGEGVECGNEVTDLDDHRVRLYIASLGLSLAMLLPAAL